MHKQREEVIGLLVHIISLTTGAYRVLVLTPEDGQHAVVEAAVGVCQAALEKGVAVEQVDTNMVHNRISSEQQLLCM